ncbi:hypothetical protein B0H16DRAFT_1718457 [Mycena metata]|uniref:Uncharacterized protein n=1 Tax=Mycena metata TaxID=1033252 RepID=A0AAD7JH88_9AGAR|nr:hypothetical protein B0H16DRAFT_1718457 [Mycena metata]
MHHYLRSGMSYRLDGVQAMDETDFHPELLISPDTDSLRWTCQVLRNLAFYGLVRVYSSQQVVPIRLPT